MTKRKIEDMLEKESKDMKKEGMEKIEAGKR